jgi:hypothetical protein
MLLYLLPDRREGGCDYYLLHQLIQVVCIFLGECPRHEAAFINFWTVRHSATVFCDSTGGRGAAFITVIIVDGNIDNDGGNVDISGEFVNNFHFFS